MSNRRIISFVLIIATLFTGTLFLNIESYGYDFNILDGFGDTDAKLLIGAASVIGTYRTTANLNLRSGSSTASPILTTIPINTLVQVKSISGVWGYTTFNGNNGWIHLDHATIVTVANKQHKISENGLNFIKLFEGFSKYAFFDVVRWSIGYGTKCEENEYPDGITEEKATELLLDNVVVYETYLDVFLDKYSITLNQNQYDALVSFTYNLGNVWVKYDEFDLKTILINGSSNYTDQQIKDAFGQFCRAGGQVLPGLVKRRLKEAELFLTPTYSLFADVNDNAWFFSAVKYVYENKLFAGTSGTTFEPDSTMTRAMVVTVLAKMENIDPSLFTGSSFTDVLPGQWYSPAIEWAAQNKIVYGIGDGQFGYQMSVKRQDFVVMLYRYALCKNKTEAECPNAIATYTDASAVSEYAHKAVNWALANNLLVGTDNNCLLPLTTATRAQASQIVMKFYQNIIK